MADVHDSTPAPAPKLEDLLKDFDDVIGDAYQLRGMVMILVEHIETMFFPAQHRHPTSPDYFYMSPRDREILGFAANRSSEWADTLDARLESVNEKWHAELRRSSDGG